MLERRAHGGYIAMLRAGAVHVCALHYSVYRHSAVLQLCLEVGSALDLLAALPSAVRTAKCRRYIAVNF